MYILIILLVIRKLKKKTNRWNRWPWKQFSFFFFPFSFFFFIIRGFFVFFFNLTGDNFTIYIYTYVYIYIYALVEQLKITQLLPPGWLKQMLWTPSAARTQTSTPRHPHKSRWGKKSRRIKSECSKGSTAAHKLHTVWGTSLTPSLTEGCNSLLVFYPDKTRQQKFLNNHGQTYWI